MHDQKEPKTGRRIARRFFVLLWGMRFTVPVVGLWQPSFHSHWLAAFHVRGLGGKRGQGCLGPPSVYGNRPPLSCACPPRTAEPFPWAMDFFVYGNLACKRLRFPTTPGLGLRTGNGRAPLSNELQTRRPGGGLTQSLGCVCATWGNPCAVPLEPCTPLHARQEGAARAKRTHVSVRLVPDVLSHFTRQHDGCLVLPPSASSTRPCPAPPPCPRGWPGLTASYGGDGGVLVLETRSWRRVCSLHEQPAYLLS